MIIFSLLASAFSLSSLVLALPASSSTKRDVWDPPITYPTDGTIWVIGGTYNVTWDTSNKPVDVTNPIGQIWLRHSTTTTNETLLVQDFQLTAGAVNVTIPEDTLPDDDYVIILMGDSGNWSPSFLICNCTVI